MPVNSQQTIRLAVVDDDSGFVTVLAKRTEAAGWQQRTLAGAIPPEELVAMKLNALLVDPTVLGEDAWAYLERICAMLPDLGVVAGELQIRSDRFQAYVGEVSLDLTRREFELLQLLADTPGQVLEREAIYQRVWGYAMAHGDRSVDVFIRKLRQKLEKLSPGWGYIHTHFGVGYRFDPEPAEGVALTPPAATGATDRGPVRSDLTIA